MQYALLGSGRLARHFYFYFQTLDLPVHQWSRNDDPLFNTFADVLDSTERLRRTLADATHVLLAVSDSAIAPLAEKVRTVAEPDEILHFSGALAVEGLQSAHPLMTFGDRLETLEWYHAIPFLIEQGEKFEELLPGLSNPHYEIPTGAKGYYHALCSLAGNSTYMLWQKIGDQFENELGLPRDLLRPFLHQVVTNSSLSGEKNFTGPVARGDWDVVRKHLASLREKPELLRAYENYLHMAGTSGIDLPKDLP